MSIRKPFWLQDPDPDQTSVRFCCPYCFSWIRNREFEDHMRLAHPPFDDESADSVSQSVDSHRKTTH